MPIWRTVGGPPASAIKAGLAGLPISTTSVMYVAKDSQTALSEYYPYINNVTVQLRGSGYHEQQFLAATDYRDALSDDYSAAASKRISASKQYATKNEICRC